MAHLTDIDPQRPIELVPLQQHLDYPMVEQVAGLESIKLDGADVLRFLRWAGARRWRAVFEEDLQCIAEDAQGHPLLSTWIPLVTFRH